MISMVERGAMRASTKPDAIRSAALRLFLGSGLRRTSMDAIAAEANVTKQTIYRYYGSKERLFVEVLGGMAAGARTDVLEVTPSAPVTRDQLEKILLTTAQRILYRILDPKYLDLVRILIAEARDFPELARMFRAAAIEGVADALAELLQSEHTTAVVMVPDIQPALWQFVERPGVVPAHAEAERHSGAVGAGELVEQGQAQPGKPLVELLHERCQGVAARKPPGDRAVEGERLVVQGQQRAGIVAPEGIHEPLGDGLGPLA